MTRKIVCLLLAMFCLVAVFASCDSKDVPEETTEIETQVVCEAHVDADKNLFCDTCQTPVLTIIEKVPTEEEIVDTIVSAIPSDATIKTIYNCSVPATTPLPEASQIGNWRHEGQSIGSTVYFVHYISVDESNPENRIYTDVKKIYDVALGKDVVPEMRSEYSDSRDPSEKFNVSLISSPYGQVVGFTIEAGNLTYDYELDYSYYNYKTTYYTLSGKIIQNEDAVEGEYLNVAGADTNGDFTYVTLGNTTFVIDNATYDIVHSELSSKFVERPTFYDVVGNYGYVLRNNRVLVYDLTKWIDCVFSYDISSARADQAELFVLNNGNALIQSFIRLPNSSVNYDVTVGGEKYDVCYTLINVTEKTATDVELGYYIDDIEIVANDDDNAFSSAVKNVISVTTIENKMLGHDLILFADDDLKILGENGAIMPDAKIESFELIATNRFVGTVVYGEGSSVRILYNESGAPIATLPNAAIIKTDFIYENGRFYDFDMKLLLDASERNMNVVTVYPTYALLQDENYVTYYYSTSTREPVQVAAAADFSVEELTYPVVGTSLIDATADYFVVKTTTYPAPGEITQYTYKIYNSKNNLILNCESIGVSDIEVLGDIAVIVLNDGNVYIAK